MILLIVLADCDSLGGIKGKVPINEESLNIPAPMISIVEGEYPTNGTN